MFNLLSHVPVSRGSFNFSTSGDSKYRTLCRAWTNPLLLKYGPRYFPCWDLKKNFKTKATTRFLHKKSELKVYAVMEVPFHSADNQLMNSVNVTYPWTVLSHLFWTLNWRISLRQTGLTHLAGRTLSQKIFYMYNRTGFLPERIAAQIQVASE